MYNSFIVGVPLSGGWAPTVYHQFKDNEGGERRRLNDHRLILTNQRLPGTAYVTHCFHVSPPALHYRTSSKKGFCIHHSSWLIQDMHASIISFRFFSKAIRRLLQQAVVSLRSSLIREFVSPKNDTGTKRGVENYSPVATQRDLQTGRWTVCAWRTAHRPREHPCCDFDIQASAIFRDE